MATSIGKRCVFIGENDALVNKGAKGTIISYQDGRYAVKWDRRTVKSNVVKSLVSPYSIQIEEKEKANNGFYFNVAIHKQETAKTVKEATAAFVASCNKCCNLNCVEHKCPIFHAHKAALARIESTICAEKIKNKSESYILVVRPRKVSPIEGERKRIYHILNKASKFYESKNSDKAITIDEIIVQMDLDKTMGVTIIAKLCENRELKQVAKLIKEIKL